MPAELHIRKRVLTLLVLLIFLFGVLVCRIAYLTTARSAELTSRGVRQWTREGTVYARRGNILDTNGQTLVMSATAYIVSVEPGKVQDVQAFARVVSPILGLSEEKVAEKASQRGKSSVTLKRQVSRETADQLRQLKQSKDAETAAAASALLFDEDVRRVYLRGAFLTQTLGLVNVDGVGQSGLEQQYETLLRGEAGRSMRSVDGKARPIYDSGNLYIEPQDGSTIRLTIDATIQEIVEKAMRECYEVNKAQAVHTLVMDVYTGAVLAMCSKPDYDPNDPPREQLDALQSLMRIRLISDSYEPGSTFKILTAAAALDSGVTTPEDGFYCSGKIKVDGDTIKCWGSPHKAETMAQALQNSCNPVFVELALRMGAQRFYQYLHAFGLGSKTNIDLQGEESGILIPVNSVKNVDLARIGFGQSVAVTPIQMLTAACSVLNGGRLMRPYLLKEAVSPDGTVLYRTSPKVVSTPISEETSLTMRKLLEDEMLPYLFERFGNDLHIWSAACSTGDEPYTLVMLLAKFIPLDKIHVYATDIDRQVLEKAQIGIYDEKSLKGLPKEFVSKYFTQVSDRSYQISDQIKRCVKFCQHNLLKDRYPKECDMIVCRNVMIYFTEEAKKEIYQKFNASLKKDGLLFVGSTEQIISPGNIGFASFKSFFYKRL